MACVELLIVNKLGLHARAATKLVQMAMKFESEVYLLQGETKVNGKSILGILLLAASFGKTIQICAEGKDEQTAIAAITELVKNKFGESS